MRTLLTLLLIWLTATAAVAAQAPQGQAASSYPQTPDGFEAQVTAAVEAYQNGDTAGGRRLLEQFRLPDPGKWLAENIGPEQSDALAKRYDKLIGDFLDFMDKTLTENEIPKKHKVAASLKPAMNGQPRKPSGIVPLKNPVCFNGNFSIALTGKRDVLLKGDFKATLWEDTFVYQDGAFRFVGRGGWPFWQLAPGGD
jgi:hypothetical protein